MDGQNPTLTLDLEMIGEEILPRLPVKSLLKFRCVPKLWRSLIDSERFIKIHHRNSTKKHSFPHKSLIIQTQSLWPKQCPMLPVLMNESNLDPFLSEDDPTNIPLCSFKVVGCCNGLVCILQNPATFIIWNPSTRMTKKLPEISRRNIITANSGFGRVESSDEYKVFATFKVADSNNDESKLYSSKTKSWKSVQPMPYIERQVGVFLCEKLHYRIRRDIVFFDLKSEVFGLIKTTAIPRRNSCFKLFGVLGDQPCVLQFNFCSGEVVEVWVLKEYGWKDCWERVVSCDRVLELLRQPRSAPFSMGPNGEIVVLFRRAFLVYCPRDNVFRLLLKCQHDGYIPCIESLESPEAL